MQPQYRDAEATRRAEEGEDEGFYSQQAPYVQSRYFNAEAEESDGGSQGESDGENQQPSKNKFRGLLFFFMR